MPPKPVPATFLGYSLSHTTDNWAGHWAADLPGGARVEVQDYGKHRADSPYCVRLWLNPDAGTVTAISNGKELDATITDLERQTTSLARSFMRILGGDR